MNYSPFEKRSMNSPTFKYKVPSWGGAAMYSSLLRSWNSRPDSVSWNSSVYDLEHLVSCPSIRSIAVRPYEKSLCAARRILLGSLRSSLFIGK